MWKKIPCVNNKYVANEFGQIKKIDSNLIKSTYKDKQGYERVGIYFNNKDNSFRVHNLVMNAFYGEKPFDKAEINHIDGDKMNNKLENLEWCTAKENCKHAVENGAYPKSEDLHNAKYKETDIINMYWLYKSGYSINDIAVIYNEKNANITRIIDGSRWGRTYKKYFAIS